MGLRDASQFSPMNQLADIRKSYEKGVLEESSAPDQPFKLFQLWLDAAVASQLPEPTAMTLATVGAQGRPSTRVVLLKGYDESGLVWFTHYTSRKGQDLARQPYAALQFHWVEHERVVRIEGRVTQVAESESDAYFQSRPLESRVGAWASEQSAVIASREVLDQAWARQQAHWGTSPARPPHWGGYRLSPDMFEFWQGRASRLHDRLRYRLEPHGSWVRERLAP